MLVAYYSDVSLMASMQAMSLRSRISAARRTSLRGWSIQATGGAWHSCVSPGGTLHQLNRTT